MTKGLKDYLDITKVSTVKSLRPLLWSSQADPRMGETRLGKGEDLNLLYAPIDPNISQGPTQSPE